MSASAASYQCMFCRLRATEKSEEHPILNALGGTLSRSRMICGDCNNGTGSGIDAEFLKALEWVTTIVNPKNRRRPAKRLRKLKTAEGELLSIEPGGKHRRLPYGRWIGDANDAERVTAFAEAAADAESKRQGVEVSVDPVTGAHSVSHPDVAPPELENWSTDPGSDHQQRMKDAINRVSALWQRRGDKGRLDRIFNEAWTEVMTEPGKPITQDHVDRLSRIIVGRTVEFMAKTKRLK